MLLAWHTPLPLQVSGLSHSPLVCEPQVAPAALFGCVHTPPPQTSFVQSLVSGVHAPEMLFAWHTPLPLQVSGLSHSPLVCEPQVAPAALFGCVHTPPPQTSFVQSLVSGVHAPERSEERRAGLALQASGSSHSPLVGEPQVAPAALF